MATPLGHSIVGYLVARALGVRSPAGLAAAVAAANLPDADAPLGHVVAGDPFSLHRKITHEPAFPLLIGAATGVAVGLFGRGPARAKTALRSAALAAVLVGSHVAMDVAPLPYDTMSAKTARFWQAVATHAWNAVIDLAVYGALALLVLRRERSEQREDTVEE